MGHPAPTCPRRVLRNTGHCARPVGRNKAKAATEGPLLTSSRRPSPFIHQVEELAPGRCKGPSWLHPREHRSHRWYRRQDLGSALWFCNFHFENFLD